MPDLPAATTPATAGPGPDLRPTGTLRVDLLTREFPPNVYGGAGVHVAELAAVLRLSLIHI